MNLNLELLSYTIESSMSLIRISEENLNPNQNIKYRFEVFIIHNSIENLNLFY